jgi:hypothetical protein
VPRDTNMKPSKIAKTLNKVIKHENFNYDTSSCEIIIGGKDSLINDEIYRLVNSYGKDNDYFKITSLPLKVRSGHAKNKIIIKDKGFQLIEEFKWWKRPMWQLLVVTIILGVTINLASSYIYDLLQSIL